MKQMSIIEAKSLIISVLENTPEEEVPTSVEFRKALETLLEHIEEVATNQPYHHGDPWNESARQTLCELYQEGQSPAELANLFQRSERSVKFMLYNIGLIKEEPE